MKIEFEDLESPDGCLLRLGSIYTRFSSRAEAEKFVQILRGRVDAVKLGCVPHALISKLDDVNKKTT